MESFITGDGARAMSSHARQPSSLLLVALLVISPLTSLASGTVGGWSSSASVNFPEGGGNITITPLSIPEGDVVLDSWVRISEDGMSELDRGPAWEADAHGSQNFSWGLWDNTTANYFDGSLSLAANHSVGRMNDFETLTRTLQEWSFGGTQGVWEVDDMLGISGPINGSGRESSGGLIPIGAVTGRYIVATKADQALPSGVHTWLESPDFLVPAVINDFNLTFSHWQHMYTPSDGNGMGDGAWVEASLDGGQNWTYLTPENGYNNLVNPSAPTPSGAAGQSFPVWASVNASGWRTARFHLDNIAGISNTSTIRFRLVAWTDVNSTIQRPGWFIDNVNLTNTGADPGSWFHGNRSGYYADGAESSLTFAVDLANASGPIMLDYAVDFDMEGDIYDNFRWEWSLTNFTWNAFSADMPGFGVLIDGQMYIDDSRGWKHLAHPLPQSLAGNSTVYIRVYLQTDSFPGSGFGGLTLDPPEGLFIDDVSITSGYQANKTTHLYLNFTDINSGNATHSPVGNAIDEWQHLTDHGVNGPTYQADSFENSPLLPEGWRVETDRGYGWEFGAHNPTWTYGPDQPANGTHYAGIVLGGQYQPNTWTHLTSPQLAIPAGSHATLSFDQFVCAEVSWDGGVVYISDDDGRSWTPFGQNEPDFYETQQTMNPQSNIYNLFAMDGSISKPTCHGQRGSGVNKSWVTKRVDVSQFGGQSIRVRFSFFTDQLLESDGWYLDNVGIYVDWFENYGTWLSDPIYPQDLLGLDALEIDADVPNGTWVRATVLKENGELIAEEYTNMTLPATLLALEGDGWVNSTNPVRIRLELGTDEAQLTPKIHALHVGATRVLNPNNLMASGWSVSPVLNVNHTAMNITNPVMATQTITSLPLIPTHPLSALRVSGHGAGVLLTFRDEAGATIASGTLVNNTVQSTTPFSLFTVEVAIQPGGWLNHLEVEGIRLSPAVGTAVDIGDDGTAEWQWPGYTAWGAVGWQTQAYRFPDWLDPIWEPCEQCLYAYGPLYNGTSLRRTSYQLSPDLGVSAIISNYSFALPSDASPRGLTMMVRLSDQSSDAVPENITFTMSGGGQVISTLTEATTQATIHLSPITLSQLNQTRFTSSLNQTARDWTSYHLTVNLTGTPSDSPTVNIDLLSVEYDYTENLTDVAPIFSSFVNSTNPVNGSHNLPLGIGSWQGGIGIWGEVEHHPLISDELVSTPTTFVPDRPMTIKSTHSHVFDSDQLVTANLTITSPTGELISLAVRDLGNGGQFTQTGGGGMLALDGSASTVSQENGAWVVSWAVQTSWGWDDVDWLDLSTFSWTAAGEQSEASTVRMGMGGVAVENDMEIDSFEVRAANGRLLSDTSSPFYPFEVAVNATIEVAGTVRFEDTSLRPNGEDYQLVIQIDGAQNRTVQTYGSENGDWNLTFSLTESSGEVNVSAWILRPGPSGVSLTGATDATKNRPFTTLVIDSNPPKVSRLMAHTPSGPRLADGNVWPENRPLPISVTVDEAEALGSALFLHYWRAGIDDVDRDGLADDWEYSSMREITPLKASGAVTIHFPAINLVANGEMGAVSLFVSGSDLAGHPVTGGGGPGLENDMATLTTQDDQPTSISLPSIALDRWGDNLLSGVEHRFSFEMEDGNGIASLDNITVSLAGDDESGDIWFDGLSLATETHPDSPINPHSLNITDLENGRYFITLTFSIGLAAPADWNTTAMSPGVSVVEHGQNLELGSDSIYPLAWTLDPRIQLITSSVQDITEPTSVAIDGRLFLMPDDEFLFTGELRHRANAAEVTLAGDWGVDIVMEDDRGNTHEWNEPLMGGRLFTTTERVTSLLWGEGVVALTATLVGASQTVSTPPLEFELVIDDTPPQVDFPENTLITMNSDRMMQQLVTVRVFEEGGMAGQTLLLNWSFRRHGIEIQGLSGIAPIELATSSGDVWTYSSRVDFDIDTERLLPGDELVIWMEGVDLAGHTLAGEGSREQPRLVILKVIYFHPVVSSLLVTPDQPLLEERFTVEGMVTNEGNQAGQVEVALWAWIPNGKGEGGRYVTLESVDITMLPQQHALFSFETEAWKTGDLQLYIALDEDIDNLTSVPLGMVREKTTSEVFIATLATPAAIGFAILLVIVGGMVASSLIYGRRVEWDEDEDEVSVEMDEDSPPPPPPWPADDWPEGAGPPPEILTSPDSRHEEE